MTLQIADDDVASRNSSKRTQKIDDGRVLEMMQEQGTVHDIEGGPVEGKPEGIRDYAGRIRAGEVMGTVIERSDAGLREPLPHHAAHVAGGRADIQHREALRRLKEAAKRLPENVVAAEEPIDANEIAQARRGPFGRLLIEKFVAENSHSGANIEFSMELVAGNIGWIEVICGPMFSGKSEELMRRLRRAMIARKRVQVFKPVIDTRYSTDEIVSHGAIRMKSATVGSAGEILQALDWRTQVVGVDEANFLGPELIEIASQLADSGKQVLLAGLDTDFMGRPFSPVPELLAQAESITKTLAICMRCGNPAKHTQRLVESADLIVVGAAGMYEARCRRCFEPGIPKQEYLDFARPELISARAMPGTDQR
jgi:thymidine kinase